MSRLQSLVEQQQVQIDELRQDCQAMREEAEVLRELLQRAQILRHEQFLAHAHRRRFKRMLQWHPRFAETTPLEVLQTPGLLHSIMTYAGQYPLSQCAATSRTICGGLDLPARRLYAVGGSDGAHVLGTVECFNRNDGTWEAVPPMPTPRSHLAACSCRGRGRLYAIGGTAGAQVLDVVEMFDTRKGMWNTLPSMPTARTAMAAAACGEYLYVVGGREGLRSLGTAERFHLETERWEPLPPMRCRRRFLAATVLQAKVYAVGGEDDSFAALDTVECFNPQVNQWVSTQPMPTRRRGLAVAALQGKLFAIGGGAAQTQGLMSHVVQALSTVEVYSAGEDQWTSLPPMPAPRMFLAAAAMCGKLYTLGGTNGSQIQRRLDRYDADTKDGSWMPLPSMSIGRKFFAAAVA